MKVVKSAEINFDNCASLEDALNMEDPEQRSDYEYTQVLTGRYVLSKSPLLRANFLGLLKSFYNENLRVHQIKKDGFIWAYISPTRDEAYFFVDKYKERDYKESPELKIVK